MTINREPEEKTKIRSDIKQSSGKKPEEGLPEFFSGSQWHPMSTAPKDGTWLLVYLSHVDEIAFGRWSRSVRRGTKAPSWAIATRSYRFRFDADRQPSHWMPLPTPPVEPEKTQDHSVPIDGE
jgi:hypothetical protein